MSPGARMPTDLIALRRAVGPMLLAGAMALSACGGDDDATPATGGTSGAATATSTPGSTSTAPPTSTGSPTTTTTTTGTTTADGIDPMAGASTRPVVVPATNTRTALLTGVAAARHEGYDRVVFRFRNALPGYAVRYVERPLREDGSGRIVPIDGAFVVQIRMENALDADLEQESAPRTYTGPTRISPGTPELRELVRTGGFEGVLTWAVGLNDRVDFRVSTLTGPPRLIIDFRNH